MRTRQSASRCYHRNAEDDRAVRSADLHNISSDFAAASATRGFTISTAPGLPLSPSPRPLSLQTSDGR